MEQISRIALVDVVDFSIIVVNVQRLLEGAWFGVCFWVRLTVVLADLIRHLLFVVQGNSDVRDSGISW